MTKRRAIIKRIGKQAKANGLEFVQASRKGSNHDIYLLDGMIIPIPRHNDIPENTTHDIYRECEPKLGKEWWR